MDENATGQTGVGNPVVVVGRFPPPLDGQAIATRRLAQLLEPYSMLRRIDVSTGESSLAESDVRLRAGRIPHYLACRKRLRATARSQPHATVLWTGISGSTLGHFRDLTVILPILKRHRKVYAVVHWGNFHELFTRLSTRFTAQRMMRQVAGVVFLNDTLRRRSAAWVPEEKQIIIPNTIDESILLDDSELDDKRAAHRERATFNLLYLGSMTASKGWADVVRAAEILDRQKVDVRLDLVGRWESEQSHEMFTDYITHRGLSDIVHHHGTVTDRSRVKDFFRQADAFVLPTYYPTEAQPLTIIEALNAGTPVITTRHAGIPDMVDDRVEGYLVSPQQPEAIAAAVQRMMNLDRWNALSVAARERFERQFAPDTVRDLWLELVQ